MLSLRAPAAVTASSGCCCRRAPRPAPAAGTGGRAGRRLRCAAARRGGQEDQDLLAEGCPVPLEQQPIVELKQLQEMALFDWAQLPLPAFAGKLASAWLGFFLALGLPVSAFTFDLHKELVQCLCAASAGSSFVVTVLVWRLYLGYQHVGDRLISATVAYEENGWFDGQVWVKPPQMLMRDRLMSNYTVKPALARLKRTLLGLGGSLAAAMVLLAAVPPPSVNGAAYDYSLQAAAYSPAAVARYEPSWAAEQEQQGAAAPQFDMRGHMSIAQQ